MQTTVVLFKRHPYPDQKQGHLGGGQTSVDDKCHFRHGLFRAFRTCALAWLMALSALLRLCEKKALFVVVRPSSLGIACEAVNGAVRYYSAMDPSSCV